jgi:predicted nucleic acid-binding protein
MMMSAFQNEWHSQRAVMMRDYLHSKEFENLLNKAISKAYGKNISYENIDQLLTDSELKGRAKKANNLTKFESRLKNEKYPDPSNPNQFLFTAYQALNEVLLSFDRLAIVRDDELMMDKFIKRYTPPIRDLSTVLQAFIAVRIMLRDDFFKNYKKDYMHLLALLNLDTLNLKLFETCKEGLVKREWLSSEEIDNWERLIQQRKNAMPD